MEEVLELRQNMPLFNGINKSELSPMLKCLGAYKKSFEKGTYIFMEDDQIQNIGVVLSGTIHMVKEDVWGNKALITSITEGKIFGETYVCSSSLASTVSFYSISNCNVLFLPFQRIIKTCSNSCVYHHKLIENMMILIAEKNLKLIEKIDITSKKSIREKILTYLSNQTQKNEEKQIIIPLGRIELADYLCVNRSALTRELSKMKDEGLIDYDKNTFYLIK